MQLEALNEKGKIRGHSNCYKTEDYVKEASKLLETQGIKDPLKSEILNIISRRRAYYEGPGSYISPTPYGRFFEKDGQIVEVDLIEKMRGHCSIFQDELRAPKMSASAEIFNILNDINNLTVQGRKVTQQEKEKLFEHLSEKNSLTLKSIAKILEIPEQEITGYRIDKNEKPVFTELKGYKKIKKLFKKDGRILSLQDYEMIDFIVEIVTKKKGIGERTEALSTSPFSLSNSLIENLANINDISGYHSLSFKALRLLNEELFKTSKNQMQLIHELELFENNRISQKGKKNIAPNSEAILSPVAKRAQNEAIKVVNLLRKKYGEFDSIVIETTRDKNSEEKKKRINDSQKRFENEKKQIDQLLKDRGFDPDKVKGKVRTKIRLYQQQECKSAYTLQPLDLDRIIKDDKYTEIDHIIPISISLDDSLNNKVLALHSENHVKGNLTPFMAFHLGKFNGMGANYQEFKSAVLNNKNIPYLKRLNLLNEEDITKFTVIEKFINRNLVDTSYATRTIMNTLQDYFKDNEIKTNIFTVKGKTTDWFRRRIHLEKDRDEDYFHHAIDALIVASVSKQPLLRKYLIKYDFEDLYNEITGEIKRIPEDSDFLDEGFIQYILNLKTIYEESNHYYKGVTDKSEMTFQPIKISHKINTKPNRQIADETIYSAKIKNGEEILIERIKDIYDPKEKAAKRLVEDILNHDTEKYLMQQKDPKTFEEIERVVQNHYETFKDDGETYKKDTKNGKTKIILKGVNPLSKYKEEFGPVYKYSKSGHGPAIISMKYESEKLGNHWDISSHYDVKNKKVILKQISPYRTDFYQCQDGKFRFVTVRYTNVAYEKNKSKFVIDKEWYALEKKKKRIDDDAKFLFSLHRDELIGIAKDEGKAFIYDESTENKGEKRYHDGVHQEILKFTATNNDLANKIEVKPIFTYCKKQLKVSIIGVKSLAKYSTDVLGNLYRVTENELKLEFE